MGYCDTKSALADHVDKEDKQIIQKGQIATFDIPNRGMTIINESGLYSLILSSKMPDARRFKRWVTVDRYLSEIGFIPTSGERHRRKLR